LIQEHVAVRYDQVSFLIQEIRKGTNNERQLDFVRRRMSVVVEDETGLNTLICKGAVDEVMSRCSRVEIDGAVIEVLPEHDAHRRQMVDQLNAQGFRVIALAYKEMPGGSDEPVYSVKDEADMISLGFLSFLDPPKESAAEALQGLHHLNVDVKILLTEEEFQQQKTQVLAKQ